MPQKQAWKPKTELPARKTNRGRAKAATVLGVGGALSLTGGASATIVDPAQLQRRMHRVT
jgi:hypothetical protein